MFNFRRSAIKITLSITLFLGAPVLSQGLQPDQELQLWNEVKHCPYTNWSKLYLL